MKAKKAKQLVQGHVVRGRARVQTPEPVLYVVRMEEVKARHGNLGVFILLMLFRVMGLGEIILEESVRGV